MIAIVPLIFSTSYEASFWRDGEGREHVEKVLSILKVTPRIEQVVLIVAKLEKWGVPSNDFFQIVLCESSVDPFSEQDFSEFIVNAIPSPTADILVVDIRNLSLDAEVVNSAIARFDTSEQPLIISVVDDDDHVCQWKNIYSVHDAGVIHLGDRKGEELHLRPYPSASAQKGNSSYAVPCVVQLKNGEDNTAGVFSQDLAGADVDGSALRRVVQESDDFRISFPCVGSDQQLFVFLQAFRNADPRGESQPTFQEKLSAGKSIRFQLTEGYDFLTYAILQPLQEGPYDLMEPIEPFPGLWGVNQGGNITLPESKEVILGRQAFSSVVVQDSALTIAKGKDFVNMQTLLAKENAVGVEIQHKTFAVEDSSDAALASAILGTASCGRVTEIQDPVMNCS